MPILTVKVSGKKSTELNQQIRSHLMDITTRILKKKPELIAIAIEYIDHDSWFIGGETLSDIKMNSVYFDIKITDETNTKDEKALYIKEAFEGFSFILENLHDESYIYIEDVRATAYGFGGLTQEYRYHH